MDFVVMFDMNFVAEGCVCVSSILKYGPHSRVFVLNLDRMMEHVVPRMLPDKRVVNISLTTLEARYPRIAITRSSRPWAPYTQSLKPFLPEYIFDTFGSKTLTYVDSDMLFWGQCEEVDREMGGNSFMVTSREQEPPLQCGSFNGGCFSCRNDQQCRAFLKWWQERCIEWCLWRVGPDGKFGEEGYLNIIRTDPHKFAGTYVSRHPGINLAPWNIKRHRLDKDSGMFVVDCSVPLVCYHYQGMGSRKQSYAIPKDSTGREATELYVSYGDLLSTTTDMLRHLFPELPLTNWLPFVSREVTQ